MCRAIFLNAATNTLDFAGQIRLSILYSYVQQSLGELQHSIYFLPFFLTSVHFGFFSCAIILGITPALCSKRVLDQVVKKIHPKRTMLALGIGVALTITAIKRAASLCVV